MSENANKGHQPPSVIYLVGHPVLSATIESLAGRRGPTLRAEAALAVDQLMSL
jgi:hypothetical protein